MKLATASLALSTVTFGLILGVAQNAQAVTIATASTNMGTLNGDLLFTYNGAGLTGNQHVSSNNNNPTTFWQSQTGTRTGQITFNFSQSYELGGFDFWNLHGTGNMPNRGINEVTIEYSNDNGLNYSLLTGPGIPTSFAKGATNTTAPQGPSNVVTFSPVFATNIRLNVLSNFGGPGTASTGFNEIKFKSIPEPSASLALLGLGLAGVGLRKRI
jgi:hypothetical protein